MQIAVRPFAASDFLHFPAQKDVHHDLRTDLKSVHERLTIREDRDLPLGVCEFVEQFLLPVVEHGDQPVRRVCRLAQRTAVLAVSLEAAFAGAHIPYIEFF